VGSCVLFLGQNKLETITDTQEKLTYFFTLGKRPLLRPRNGWEDNIK
jgi:hypothetical protein